MRRKPSLPTLTSLAVQIFHVPHRRPQLQVEAETIYQSRPYEPSFFSIQYNDRQASVTLDHSRIAFAVSTHLSSG